LNASKLGKKHVRAAITGLRAVEYALRWRFLVTAHL